MQDILAILAITTPIYLIIFLGFGLTKLGLFAKADMRVFGKFVINLALPALVFRALALHPISEIINTSYIAAYMLGSWLILGLGYLWARRVAGLAQTTSAFYAMGMTCSNSGFVGYPILLLILPSIAGVALALNMLIENLFVIPILLFLAERGRGGSSPRRVVLESFKRLATNPLILGLLAGLVVAIFEWKLPAPLSQTINMFAAASGALSLFVIGGALVGLPVHGLGKQVLPIALGKLIVHPLMVMLCITGFTLLGLPAIEPNLRMAAILLAAMPMMGIYPTLAQAYGKEDFTAAALLVTTMASFFTLSVLMWALKHTT